MENTCYFVNSRGIVKSCDFTSTNPRSSWAYDTEYLINMINGPNMFDNMSIYLCTDTIPFFLNEILPHIKNMFYLVSGDSDATVPNGGIDIWHGNIKFLEENICLQIANHPKLIKWFAQNCIFTNEKISSELKVYSELTNGKICQIPIGLDYHTISNDPGKFWRDQNEGSTTKYQEMILKNIRKEMIPFHERINKIFVHNTNNSMRQQSLDQIPYDLVDINRETLPRTRIWKEIIKYSFVFSPHGNGPDCHRHWEILCLGSIPIIKTFGSDQMFEDLPVLIVKEWSDVNEDLLINTINRFKSTTFNYKKLLLKYWVDQFSSPPVL